MTTKAVWNLIPPGERRGGTLVTYLYSNLWPKFSAEHSLRFRDELCKNLPPRSGAVWPDLAKFHHFRCIGKSLTVCFLFGKMLSQLWQTCYIIFQIFTVANGQILKNNLTIWSHWSGDYSRPVPHLLFITNVWCVALLHIPNWSQRWGSFRWGFVAGYPSHHRQKDLALR